MTLKQKALERDAARYRFIRSGRGMTNPSKQLRRGIHAAVTSDIKPPAASWIPTSVRMPTREDANEAGRVLEIHSDGVVIYQRWQHIGGIAWLPIPKFTPPPQLPDKEGWIPWQGGEPPVEEKVVVNVTYRDGTTDTREAWRLRWRHKPWRSDQEKFPCDIISYRIVPKPVMIPLGPEDVPPGSVFRLEHWERGAWWTPTAVTSCGLHFFNINNPMRVTWKDLQDWHILRPGSTVWEKCEKEAP